MTEFIILAVVGVILWVTSAYIRANEMDEDDKDF